MKIAILIHNLAAGGAERVTLNVAEGLLARGHQVIVMTQEDASSDAYPSPANLERRVVGAGVRGGPVRSNLKRIANIRAALAACEPDVLICMMTTSILLGTLAAWGRKVTVIGSERIHPPRFPVGRIREAMRRLLYPQADVVVVQTQQTADWFRKAIPRSRVAVIPNAMSLPLPRHSPEVQPDRVVSADARVILAVGRLTHQKGFDLLIRAFADCRELHASSRLVIAGQGPGLDGLKEFATDCGVSDQTIFIGLVGNIADWYQRASIFVLSSRFEGFPNVLLEAMAHGCACIAFDCETGPRDIISHERDGLLVEAGSVTELGRAMQRLSDDSGLRRRLGENAGATRSLYAVDVITARWEQLMWPVAG